MFPRTRFICISSLCALLAVSPLAFAHSPDQPAHQRFEEGDLKLESG
jgi:homoserine O-acetyltransferase